MIAIIYKFPRDSWAQLGGMSVLERNLRSLDKINIEKVRIVIPPGEYPPTISIPRPLGIKQEIIYETLLEDNLLSTLRVAFPENSESALIFHANLLTDPRILVFLAGSNCAFFTLDTDATPQKNWRIALLRAKDLEKEDELWDDHQYRHAALIGIDEQRSPVTKPGRLWAGRRGPMAAASRAGPPTAARYHVSLHADGTSASEQRLSSGWQQQQRYVCHLCVRQLRWDDDRHQDKAAG